MSGIDAQYGDRAMHNSGGRDVDRTFREDRRRVELSRNQLLNYKQERQPTTSQTRACSKQPLSNNNISNPPNSSALSDAILKPDTIMPAKPTGESVKHRSGVCLSVTMQQRRMGKAHSLLAEVTCGYTVVGKTQPAASVRTGLFCSTRGDLWRWSSVFASRLAKSRFQ